MMTGIGVAKPPAGSNFTKEEMALLRGRWEEWKREFGTHTPEFRQGLDDLLNLHGYSMTDVCLFIGLTRERIRQHTNRLGIVIEVTGSQHRVWDDDAERFVSVGSQRDYQKLKRSISGPGMMKSKEIARRRRVAMWVLRDLGVDLGRTPCHADLADAYQVVAPVLNGILCVGPGPGTIREKWRVIWAEAGYDDYPNASTMGAGRPGLDHQTPGVKKEQLSR